MPQVQTQNRLDRAATWLIASLLFLLPFLHSGALADPFSLPKSIAIICFALLLAALAIASRLTRAEPSGPLPPLVLVATAFIGLAALAVLPAANRGLALGGLAEMASGALVFCAVVRFVKDNASAALLLRAVLASASVVSLGVIVQVFLSGYDISLAGISLLPPSRGGAAFGDPGAAAQFLLLALPAGIGVAALSRGAWRVACGAGLGLVISALLFAGGPEAWAAVGAVVIVAIALRALRASLEGGRWNDLAPDLAGDSMRTFLLILIVVGAVIGVSRMSGLLPSGRPATPLAGVSLLAPTTGEPWRDRAAAARGTLALIARHPLGVGPDSWRHAFLEVAWTAVPSSPFSLSHQPVHAGNSFLELAAETGILGGVAFALFLLLAIIQAGFAATRLQPPAASVGFAACATLFVGGLISFVGSPFQDPTPSLILWVMAGLALVASADAAPRIAPLRRLFAGFPATVAGRPAVAWAAAAAWVLVMAGGGIWMVNRVRASHHALLGQAAFFAGKYETALGWLEQPATRRAPEHLPRALAGNAYLSIGRYSDAVRAFTETLDRSPYFPAALHGRAAAYQRLGRYDLADEDLGKALALWPDSVDTLLLRANLDALRGREDVALESYRAIARLNSKLPEPYFRMGQILARRGNFDDAIEVFSTCGQRNPRYPGLQIEIGNAYSEKGLLEMALRYYQIAASVDPTDIQARMKMANTYHLLGKVCDAKEALEAARDLETDTGRRNAILELITRFEPGCKKEIKRSR
jgi:tetratricopeptide (TPR) repeat protein